MDSIDSMDPMDYMDAMDYTLNLDAVDSMESISYIEKLLNYATRNMVTTYKLKIEPNSTSYNESTLNNKLIDGTINITHNLFDDNETMITQPFSEFIWVLKMNYSEDEEQIAAHKDPKGDYLRIQKHFEYHERTGSYKELCNAFVKVYKTRKN
jgi:hypothetical protein